VRAAVVRASVVRAVVEAEVREQLKTVAAQLVAM
jgi:hypothetical protein